MRLVPAGKSGGVTCTSQCEKRRDGDGDSSLRPACLLPLSTGYRARGCTAHLLCSLQARKEAGLPHPSQRDLKIRKNPLPGWS